MPTPFEVSARRDGNSAAVLTSSFSTLAETASSISTSSFTMPAPEEEATLADSMNSEKAQEVAVAVEDNGVGGPVTFGGPEDMGNPKNWSKRRRWALTFLTAGSMTSATFASSAPSGVARQTQEAYGCTDLQVTAIMSLFVAGYVFGPLAVGPASESFGRRPVMVAAFAFFTAFALGSALAENIETMLVCRLFAGIAASTPLTVVGAIIAELWHPHERSLPMGMFAIAPFGGPQLGPLISGFMGLHLPFSSVYWLVFAWAATSLLLIFAFLPETYTPVLLVRKAQRLRESGEDPDAWAAMERRETQAWAKKLGGTLARPLIMLCTEATVFFMSLYCAVVYGVYSMVFEGIYGLNAGVTGLMFIPLFVGGVVCVTIVAPFFDRRQQAAIRAGKIERSPEIRLPPTFVGGPMFAVSLFWFGWSSYTGKVHWAGPAASGFLFGIMQAFGSYLAEAYGLYAASALAANTVLRSILATLLPLAGRNMIDVLGVQWASTLLGGVACLLVPVPFLFYRYGAVLRARSAYMSE
ncbi:hypothetical protein JCM5296_004768 [Sporobolomyces johnsonii]